MAGPWEKYQQAPAASADGPWAKYAAPDVSAEQTSEQGSIGPRQGGVSGYLNDLESDVRYGSDITMPGKILKALGAKGTNSGVSEETANRIASPVLGALHAAQGVAETPQHPVAGPLKAIGGVLDAASLPASFMAPEVGEATAQGATDAVDAAGNALRHFRPAAVKEQAGQLFSAVAKNANDAPVQLTRSGDQALELMKWQRTTQLGPTINKFLNRITAPNKGPLTYDEARQFYQVFGDMSVNEKLNLPGAVKFTLNRLRLGLKDDIGDTAAQAGKAAEYYKAMGDWSSAKRMEDVYSVIKKYAIRGALAAAGGGLIKEGYGLASDLQK